MEKSDIVNSTRMYLEKSLLNRRGFVATFCHIVHHIYCVNKYQSEKELCQTK